MATLEQEMTTAVEYAKFAHHIWSAEAGEDLVWDNLTEVQRKAWIKLILELRDTGQEVQVSFNEETKETLRHLLSQYEGTILSESDVEQATDVINNWVREKLSDDFTAGDPPYAELIHVSLVDGGEGKLQTCLRALTPRAEELLRKFFT